MATAKNTNSDAKRVKELEKQIKQLTDMVALLSKNAMATPNQPVVNNIQDRDINFISLCPNMLNLSTLPNGEGSIYTFNHFGEEQAIPYSDAKAIVKSNRSFIQNGHCYIADDDFIKSEHLEQFYKKILNEENMLKLFSMNRAEFASVFNSMTDTQKESFRDMLIEKVKKNKNSVDMNIVQIVNDALNIDVLKSAEYSENLLKNEE